MADYSLRRAGIVMIAVTIAARGLGYVREVIVASIFGTSSAVDLYLAAMTIPAIGVTTAYYSIPNAFVPLWTSAESVRKRARRVGVVVILIALVVSAMLWLFATPLTRGLAPGFDETALTTASALLQICSWSILFAVIEALLRSHLLASRRFALPGISYAWQGAVIIIASIGWPEHGPFTLAWGFLLGTVAATLWSLGLVLNAARNLSTEGTGRRDPPMYGMVPWVLAVLLIDALSQVLGIVDRSLGSYLQTGAIASLNYASMLAGFPQAIVGLAIATAVFPFMSASAAADDRDRIASIVDRSVRWSMLIVTPLVVWFAIFSRDIVTILYQRGAFDQRSTAMSASVLLALSVGILPCIFAGIWCRALYADRRWKWPLLAVATAIATKIACSLWWTPTLGLAGLAAATSAAFVASAAVTWWSLDGRIKSFAKSWTTLLLRLVILTTIPAALARWLPMTIFDVTGLRLALGIAGGVVLLGLVGRRWNIPEIDRAVDVLRTRASG